MKFKALVACLTVAVAVNGESISLNGEWKLEYWDQPLSAFGGKTGYEVAEEAFRFHGSQVRRDWSSEIHGDHDNAHFGLYFSSVGLDSGLGDLMEHIDFLPERT